MQGRSHRLQCLTVSVDRPSIVFMKGQAHALPRRKNLCLQNPLAPKNLLAIYSLIAVALLADDTHYPVSHENRHKPGNHRPAPFCRRRRRKKRLGPSLAGLVPFACEGSRRRHFKRGASVDHQAGVRDGSRARGCESAMSEGQQIDLDQYGRLTGRLCRLLEMFGIRRLARPIDPLSDLAKAFEDTAKAIDDEDEDSDEPLPPEKGSDKSEPGEA